MEKNTETSKKPLSLKAAVGYKNILLGISYICLAISSMVGYKPLRVVFSIIGLVGSVLALISIFKRKEKEDEMYKRHIGEASEFTVAISTMLFVFAGLFSDFLSNYFTVGQVIFFVIGITTIMYGAIFLFFEKIGD